MKNTSRTIEQKQKLIELLTTNKLFSYLSTNITIDKCKNFKDEYISQNINDNDGVILSIAIKKNNYSCVNFLLDQNNYSENELYQAMRESVQTGYLHIIKLFFEKKKIPFFTTKLSKKQQTPFRDLFESKPENNSSIIYWHASTASYFIDKCNSMIEILTCGNKNINPSDILNDNILILIHNSKFEPHHKVRIAMKICDRLKELYDNNTDNLEIFFECLSKVRARYRINYFIDEILKYCEILFSKTFTPKLQVVG